MADITVDEALSVLQAGVDKYRAFEKLKDVLQTVQMNQTLAEQAKAARVEQEALLWSAKEELEALLVIRGHEQAKSDRLIAEYTELATKTKADTLTVLTALQADVDAAKADASRQIAEANNAYAAKLSQLNSELDAERKRYEQVIADLLLQIVSEQEKLAAVKAEYESFVAKFKA
jgi:hypothetical protein